MKTIDLDTWPRAAQYRFFRTYERPQYATTSRLDVTGMMARKPDLSPYRVCLFAIGAGIHAVPALLLRVKADNVVRYDAVTMSTTVPTASGSFNYASLHYDPDYPTFEVEASAQITRAAEAAEPGIPDDPNGPVTFLSCLPWLDYTSLNNALRDADDFIPRISWGKIVQEGDRWKMSMTLEVHHALVDGADVGAYFETVQNVLDTF